MAYMHFFAIIFFMIFTSYHLCATEEIQPKPIEINREAVVVVLDKKFGQTQKIKIPLGQSVLFDTLKITMHQCIKKTDKPPLSIQSFLEVWDHGKQSREIIFSGWLFSEKPSLSTFDHPRYDLWVDECTIVDA